jgi:uncharacterized protein
MINKIVLFFVLLGVMFTVSHAEVIDGAGMFSATAVESANKKINEVKTKTGKVLVFETIDTVNGKDPKELSIENARARKVNGVYVMVAKKEKKIEIRAGSNTRKLFGNAEATRLKEKIASGFKTGNFDTGLTNSVDYFYSVFYTADTNKVAPPTPVTKQPVHRASSSGGFSVFKILFILLIVFIIFRVISALFSRGSSQGHGYGGGGYGNQGYNSGGGMGFMGSFLTGMFGAMAGNWMYDKFFNDDSGSGTYANTNDDYTGSSYDSSGSSDSGSSWSSTDDYTDYSSGDSGSYDSDSSGGSDSDW